MTGWIAIPRDLFQHEFFPKEPMSEREAWFWMVARAAWRDTQHRVGSDMLAVARGSFFCSLRELQGIWGWGSDKRVRTFLKRLENGRMIDARTDAGKTHVTICNYEDFQHVGRSTNAAETQERRSTDALKEQGNKKQGNKKKEEPIGSLFREEPDQAPAASKPPPKPNRKRSIPPDWVPSPRNIADALGRDFTPQEIDHEADRFRDYHLARASIFSDWDAAWRTWIGNARKFATPARVFGFPSSTGRGQGSSLASIAARRIAELRD
jgi:hypothetical protein